MIYKMSFILCKTPVLNITYFKEYSVFRTENFITCPLYNYSDMTTFQIDSKKMSPLNPDLGKTGKKDMASLCGQQAFSVVVVVLFVCRTKRKR